MSNSLRIANTKRILPSSPLIDDVEDDVEDEEEDDDDEVDLSRR